MALADFLNVTESSDCVKQALDLVERLVRYVQLGRCCCGSWSEPFVFLLFPDTIHGRDFRLTKPCSILSLRRLVTTTRTRRRRKNIDEFLFKLQLHGGACLSSPL